MRESSDAVACFEKSLSTKPDNPVLERYKRPHVRSPDQPWNPFSYFAEGMRDEDFMDALDDVRDLIHEYKKQEEDTSDESLSSNTDGI